ncbi:thiamine biosynthesis protein ThiF [Iodidimonas muriae]|uniref:Thiamine biosynthesis protein ThiF n=1 Tax=Iodidimonas muriae TaxID=261467 RepID=A0ABQ2L8A1_9PROT|nr:molybdopterin-synthase adenylyltransferase MoeB [Iodidimonas muriae]GER05721.1 thiamine biosynthesis protein ThiF [Kordiimonadales bacterium JCM 17843]GGO06550.1 thiamine biosynthesis protein ThiF [Iodidimonas muriae]
MGLSNDQLDRYARHIVLHDVGGTGQMRLLNARVALVGAGGIGSPAGLYLAAAGVGHLTILDDDHVALSNLQRQVLYSTKDVGLAKGTVAATRLKALNPDIEISARPVRLTDDNAADLLAGHDLVLDGSDSYKTRLAVNRAAVALGIPLVSAALGPFEGQLSVFKGHDPALPCYQCLVPSIPPDEEAQSCTALGILGAVAGVMGSWAALEVLREITGVGESLAGRLLLFDAKSTRTRTVGLRKDPACPVCAAPLCL